MTLTPGDILYFSQYYFTDTLTGDPQPHYALLLLPDDKTKFANNVYCAVITSNIPKSNNKVVIPVGHYSCLTKASYICLTRFDYESLSDLDNKRNQPVGKLCDLHRKEAFKILKHSIFFPNLNIDPFLRGAIIREWKKVIA